MKSADYGWLGFFILLSSRREKLLRSEKRGLTTSGVMLSSRHGQSCARFAHVNVSCGKNPPPRATNHGRRAREPNNDEADFRKEPLCVMPSLLHPRQAYVDVLTTGRLVAMDRDQILARLQPFQRFE